MKKNKVFDGSKDSKVVNESKNSMGVNESKDSGVNKKSEDQWFDEQLSAQLHQFDSAHEPFVPNLSEFEAFVTSHKREFVRKQWKDLLLLWLIAVFVFSFMLWTLERDFVWFAVLQSIVLAVAILFLGITSRRRVSRRWNR